MFEKYLATDFHRLNRFLYKSLQKPSFLCGKNSPQIHKLFLNLFHRFHRFSYMKINLSELFYRFRKTKNLYALYG